MSSFLGMHDLYLGEYKTLGVDYTELVGIFPCFRGRFWVLIIRGCG